jgi:hypothetical protein
LSRISTSGSCSATAIIYRISRRNGRQLPSVGSRGAQNLYISSDKRV